MKKVIALVLAGVLSALSLSGCTSPQSSSQGSTSQSSSTTTTTQTKQSLNLYTWEGMFPKEVLSDFTAKTGIEVNYSSFDFDETMLAKLETAKGGEYDLVIADDYIIEVAIQKGLVQKLDQSKITNLKNVNPVYQGQFFDKENAYTVPYGAGVQTIVYNPKEVDVEITGYADLWNPNLKDNLGVIGNYRVINGMALKVLGESYNVQDLATIGKAGEKLNEMAANIRLIKDDNIQDDLISGEIGAAIMYTSQVTAAMLANPDLKVVFPKEGVGFGVMAQFIPVNAPNSDAAHQFIDYILQPEVAVKCFEALGYYCTNQAADALINEQYKPFLTLPKDVATDKMEMIQNVSAEAEAEHVKVWTAFKTATGK